MVCDGVMAKFGDTIRRLRETRHWSQDELARTVGVTTKAVYTWERMGANNVRGLHYRKLAEAFGLTTDALDREWRSPGIEQSVGDPGRRGIPLINKAPAGGIVNYDECSLIDSGQGLWYIARSGIEDPNAFAVAVKGESMSPALLDGVIAVFSPMDQDGHTHFRRIKIPEGHIVFVRFGMEAPQEGCTIARLFKKGKSVRLHKDNKKFKEIIVEPEHIASMAAMIRHDDLPGMTSTFPPREQLQSKGDGDSQVEGQVHPDY